MENNMVEILKKQIKVELEKEFDEYKKKKLTECNIELEKARNRIIEDTLNGISIVLDKEIGSQNTVINIRIEKKVYLEAGDNCGK